MKHVAIPDEPLPDHFADDQHFHDDDLHAEPLPPRPRRRALTPARGVLGSVVLVAAGFIGGVLVQKHQGGGAGGTSAGGPGGAAAFAARAGQGATGQAGPTPTTGTVANVKGSTLYVTRTDGTTVRVRVGANAKVTRSASSTAGAVHPGDTVVVDGSTAGSGTVTATSVTATAKGVGPAGLGGFGFGAGAPGGSASRPGGAGAAGGSGAAGLPPGFTPPGG